MALDRESVVKATPFFKAVTRQEKTQAATVASGGAMRSTKAKSLMDDARSVSAGSRVASMAKHVTASDAGPKAILAKASLTSVLFELVRSDPWETVMRAGVSGLNASFSSGEGDGGGMKAAVTLADILLTDVRPEARENPYTMILAPLVPSASQETVATASQREGVERGPLIAVTAKRDGENGDLDADVNLASFACNLMVEPIQVRKKF